MGMNGLRSLRDNGALFAEQLVVAQVGIVQRLHHPKAGVMEIVGQELLLHVFNLWKLVALRQLIERAINRIHQIADGQ